jgi:hypothetical protein
MFREGDVRGLAAERMSDGAGKRQETANYMPWRNFQECSTPSHADEQDTQCVLMGRTRIHGIRSPGGYHRNTC